MKLNRNEKCPCGSGKKYKKCCFLDIEKNTEILRAAVMSSTYDELIELLSKPLQVYQLKVTLVRMGVDEIEEEISRTFDVDSKNTLYDFHLEIQEAFNWDNDHMFSFYLGNKLFDKENEYSANPLGEHMVSSMGLPLKSASETEIRDLGLKEGFSFLYLFDYGSELVHRIQVEEIRNKSDNDITLPSVVNTAGNPPLQHGEFND